MRFRPVHAILFAALVYWTTGAAPYLHERIEHAEPDGAVAAVDDHSESSPADSHSKHHHDHDDCPTCQLLAHMQADHALPPAVVCVHLPCFHADVVVDQIPPTVDVLVFAPIRGPPMVPASLFV